MNQETAAGLDTEAAADAFRLAAARLGVPADMLLANCRNGELAEIIIELRVARLSLDDPDQQRVEELLRRIGVFP